MLLVFLLGFSLGALLVLMVGLYLILSSAERTAKPTTETPSYMQDILAQMDAISAAYVDERLAQTKKRSTHRE